MNQLMFELDALTTEAPQFTPTPRFGSYMSPMSPSEIRRRILEAQRKQKQAVDKYNREVRQHNQKVKQVVASYNREVNAYNARVRANRQRLKNELARLSRQPSRAQLVTYRASVELVNTAYERLETRATTHYDDRFNSLLDLSEQEAANNVSVLNALIDGGEDAVSGSDDNEQLDLANELNSISSDLSARWQGAVFSLSPRNPDAARHFCTSAREIIATILEQKAPDADVVAALPDCEVTERGNPTRRSRIRYFLFRRGMLDDVLEDFVEQDMQNVIDLFRFFNDGTHGSAGTFSLVQLTATRRRVEDAIRFLLGVIA